MKQDRKSTVLNGYVAIFENRREEIEAQSLYEARKTAMAIFKPKKDREFMVSVLLATVGEREITHAPTF